MGEFMWGLVLWLGALACVAALAGGTLLGLLHWYLYIRETYLGKK